MSLPAIGDVVTVLFDLGDAIVPVMGRIVDAGKFPVEDLYMLWESLDGDVLSPGYCIRAQYEDIYWMRGSGPEVDAALTAAYALAGGRGPDALTGEL